MLPFYALLSPSRSARTVSLVLHGVTLYLLWRYFAAWPWGVFTLLTLASLVYTQYLYGSMYARRIVRLEIRPDGQAVLWQGRRDETVPVRPLAGSLVSRYALLIRWQTDDGARRVIRQVVLPDMTDGESYRRLCVWLRYGPHGE